MLACFAISHGAFAGDAISQLELSTKLSPIKSAAQYYQPSKGWSSADKMSNVDRNNKTIDIATKPYRFHYLTNNNESDVVKGVVRKYVRGIKQSKHDMLNFVVLPGDTIYLGRFISDVNLKVSEAVVIDKSDLPALESNQKTQKDRISD